MERKRYNNRAEEYRASLKWIGDSVGVSLPESARIPFVEAERYINCGISILEIFIAQGVIAVEEAVGLNDMIQNNSMVFEEAEHRKLRIALKRHKVKYLEKAGEKYVDEHRMQLKKYEREDVPPGNCLTIPIDDHVYRFLTYTRYPYRQEHEFGYLPFEGVVAEEVAHSVCNI